MAKRKESEIASGDRTQAIRFEDLVGHSRQVAVLKRALDRGSLSQALLFFGPAATGKATAARMTAAALLCASPAPGACGECLHCRKMRRGVHPDFRTISLEAQTQWEAKDSADEASSKQSRPATQLKIEYVRKCVLEPLSLPPYEGKCLVFLIDGAESLNVTCQNVLLKSLEEPPSYAQFILVTTSPWALLPTLQSRCQPLAFGRLSRGEMEAWMESEGSPPEERGKILAWAAGRPGRTAGFKQKAFEERRGALLALLDGGLVISRAKGLLAITEKMAKQDTAEILRDLGPLLVDVARAGDSLPPKIHSDIQDVLAYAAASRGREGLAAIIGRVALAPSHLVHNVNPRLLWEWVFLTR